jgi:hypothetical protein
MIINLGDYIDAAIENKALLYSRVSGKQSTGANHIFYYEPFHQCRQRQTDTRDLTLAQNIVLWPRYLSANSPMRIHTDMVHQSFILWSRIRGTTSVGIVSGSTRTSYSLKTILSTSPSSCRIVSHQSSKTSGVNLNQAATVQPTISIACSGKTLAINKRWSTWCPSQNRPQDIVSVFSHYFAPKRLITWWCPELSP